MVGFERGVETSAVVALGRMVFLEVIAMLSLNAIDPGWFKNDFLSRFWVALSVGRPG